MIVLYGDFGLRRNCVFLWRFWFTTKTAIPTLDLGGAKTTTATLLLMLLISYARRKHLCSPSTGRERALLSQSQGHFGTFICFMVEITSLSARAGHQNEIA